MIIKRTVSTLDPVSDPIFAVTHIEEARELVVTDPVVVKGEMVAENHSYLGSAALMRVNQRTRKSRSRALKWRCVLVNTQMLRASVLTIDEKLTLIGVPCGLIHCASFPVPLRTHHWPANKVLVREMMRFGLLAAEEGVMTKANEGPARREVVEDQ